MERRTGLLIAAVAGVAMMTASPAAAAHRFQMKNCNVVPLTWTYSVYNGNDNEFIVPYELISFSEPGQIINGKCDGGGKGYCKVVQPATATKFRVASTKTIYGDSFRLRIYDGLLGCDNEPSQ